MDVAKSNSFEAFTEKFKTALKSEFQTETFDALVNNAGFGLHTNISDTAEEQFDTMVNVHLKGLFFLTQKTISINQ